MGIWAWRGGCQSEARGGEPSLPGCWSVAAGAAGRIDRYDCQESAGRSAGQRAAGDSRRRRQPV